MTTRARVAALKQASDAQVDRAFLANLHRLRFAYRKQQDEEADRLQLAFERDGARLERVFSRELRTAFRELGNRVADAWRQTQGGKAVKQDPALTDLADRIIRAAHVSQWQQDALMPAFDRHYLRTMGMTVNTVNQVINLNVNLPDYVGRRIVREGGTRAGLIDIVGQARQSLFQTIEGIREQGGGLDAIQRRIRGSIESGRFSSSAIRARLIARTELVNAQNRSAVASYRSSQVITGVRVRDNQYGTDSDEPCIAANGQTWSLDRADAEPLEHPNCTRSFTPVRGSQQGALL